MDKILQKILPVARPLFEAIVALAKVLGGRRKGKNPNRRPNDERDTPGI